MCDGGNLGRQSAVSSRYLPPVWCVGMRRDRWKDLRHQSSLSAWNLRERQRCKCHFDDDYSQWSCTVVKRHSKLADWAIHSQVNYMLTQHLVSSPPPPIALKPQSSQIVCIFMPCMFVYLGIWWSVFSAVLNLISVTVSVLCLTNVWNNYIKFLKTKELKQCFTKNTMEAGYI